MRKISKVPIVKIDFVIQKTKKEEFLNFCFSLPGQSPGSHKEVLSNL
jgi:hypothetical protein